MMYKDVFCSYQTESLQIVIDVCKILEDNNISCWYAARDVKESHASEIIDAIKHCKVFLLFEDSNVATEPRGDILNEINMACSLYNKVNSKIKIIRLKLTNNDLECADLIYYIGRIQHTAAFNKPISTAATELTLQINKILGKEVHKRATQKHAITRLRNDYFKVDDEQEKARLKIQQRFLETFDKDVYNRLLDGKENLTVLDIGSNDGGLIMNRLGRLPSVDLIIGTDINQQVVEVANQRWKDTKAHFYHVDVESENFVNDIRDIMAEHGIEGGFDFVNISMVILHLQNPTKVLWSIRKIMKPGGTIFIRDIDDGLNLAYPDTHEYFAKAMQICSRNEDSGFRESGRQIPSILTKAKFHNVKVEKMCINTAGMNDDEKEAFFDIYFSFILKDAMLMTQHYPNEKSYRDDYNWLKSIYSELEEDFYQEDFFFNLGFMAFSAKR